MQPINNNLVVEKQSKTSLSTNMLKRVSGTLYDPCVHCSATIYYMGDHIFIFTVAEMIESWKIDS